MHIDVRKQQVLLAIITDFISTAEPVGSRTIARKYELGVSPATIRNEMSDLEDLGFIEQPHTSAGRIPSQKGYRYYVDFLMKKKDLTSNQEEMIRKGYEKKVRGVGQVISRTGALLSEITNFPAMILRPGVDVSSFKHIQLLLMNPGQVMVIVVTSTGILHHNIIEVTEDMTQGDFDTISNVFNAKLQGLSIENIKLTIIKEIYFELSKYKNTLDLAMFLIQNGLTATGEDKVYLGGMLNILSQPEFNSVDKVKTLLGMLEQEDLLRKLLESSVTEDGVSVRIGTEMNTEEIKGCSMVIASYSVNGRPMGSVGVIGPTRMDYAWVVSVVEYMTGAMSKTIEKMFKGWR